MDFIFQWKKTKNKLVSEKQSISVISARRKIRQRSLKRAQNGAVLRVLNKVAGEGLAEVTTVQRKWCKLHVS